MRALATTVAILGVVGAIAIGNSSPVQAADQNHQDSHYNSNGGRWCPPDWTVEGATRTAITTLTAVGGARRTGPSRAVCANRTVAVPGIGTASKHSTRFTDR
jgi:hypothetical protein